MSGPVNYDGIEITKLFLFGTANVSNDFNQRIQLGVSTFCLQAALPQLLCPKHTEAYMTAQKLSAHGCGVVMTSPQDTRDGESPVSDLRKLLRSDTTAARDKVALETREWIENHDWKAKVEVVFAI